MAAVKTPVQRTPSADTRLDHPSAPTRAARRPRPPISTALRTAVEQAVDRIPDDTPAADDLAPELITTLRVGLARTSATGDTCRLPTAAVSAVREAIGHLERAELGPGRSALVTALAKLTPEVPRQAGPADMA
jgi:hypothetical protein